VFCIVSCVALVVGIGAFGWPGRALGGMNMNQVAMSDFALISARFAVFLLPPATLLGLGFSAAR
jgi:hypothetical protein